MANPNTIKDWNADDRPREKMILKGATALSDIELLAILINNGTTNKSAVDLASELYAKADNNFNTLARLSISNMAKAVKGIGPAKAVTISAALEIGRRKQTALALEKPTINSSPKIIALMQPILGDLLIEEMHVMHLTVSQKLISIQKVSSGGTSSTIVDMKVIFNKALELLSHSIILVHNHPSGACIPSAADDAVTDKVKNAAKLLDIKLADHVIITNNICYSYADAGIL
jgi:DNA repair protein RadC